MSTQNKKCSPQRIFAVEDGSFSGDALRRKKGSKAFLVGVIVHDSMVEEVLLSYITVDGLDATDRLIEMVGRKKRKFDVVLLASVAYAGFNLIDPVEIYRRLEIPVLIVNPAQPNDDAVELALKKHFPDWERRLCIVRRAGKPSELKLDGERTLYVYAFGLPEEDAAILIRRLTVFGNRPEPLRVARLMAHGLGRAS